MRDKFCAWNNEVLSLYVEDPNGNYISQVLNLSMSTDGTTQKYVTLIAYQTTTVTVVDDSSNLLAGATVIVLDASEEELDRATTDSNGEAVLKWAPPTDQS